jgi:hypothetical protein
MDTVASFLDTAFWLTTAAILALLVLSAFFSGSETALTASSRGKLRAQADKGARGAAVALKLTEDSERLIGAVLLGNNLVNILAASLATALFTRLFGDSGVALATLVMTLLVLIFAEVLPKTYAITAPNPPPHGCRDRSGWSSPCSRPWSARCRCWCAACCGCSACAPTPTAICSRCARRSPAP